ncbi:phage tail fiber protein [uncultured Mediterranean phage uvMED]|nr:phage tail fiber protein [uncultured Mediterranean phage uvMED]
MTKEIDIRLLTVEGQQSPDQHDQNLKNLKQAIIEVDQVVEDVKESEEQDKQDIEQIKEVNANQQLEINELQTKQEEIEQQVEINTDDIASLKNSSASLKNVLNPLVKLPLKSSLKGEYEGSLVFERAGEASYINRQGVRVIAAVDEPRFEKEGFLHEDISTNNLYPDSGSGAFTGSGMTATSGIDDASLTTDAMRFISNNGASNPKVNVNQPYPFVLDDYASFSIDVRPQSLKWVRLNAKNGGQDFSVFFDLEEIKEGYKSDNVTACKIKKLISGYFRISISFQAIATENNVIEICLAGNDNDYSFTGDGVSGVDVDCIQGEPLPFSTSHIKTIDSPVTRPSDKGIKIPFTQNHPNLNDAFSVLLRFDALGGIKSGSRGLFSLEQGSTTRFHLLRMNGFAQYLGYYRSSSFLRSDDFLYGETVCSAVSVTNDNVSVFHNGDLVRQRIETLISLGFMNDFVIGAGAATSAWCGHISEVMIFDCALTADEIKFMHGE